MNVIFRLWSKDGMKKHLFLAGSISFFGIKQLPFLPPNLGLGLSLSSMFNGLLYGGFLSHFWDPQSSPWVSQQEAQQLGLPERKAITERLEELKKLEEVEVGPGGPRLGDEWSMVIKSEIGRDR